MYEYTLEYKSYNDKDMYYILENEQKIKTKFIFDMYAALYVNHKEKSYYLMAMRGLKEPDKAIDLIVTLKDIIGIDQDYWPDIEYLHDRDDIYTHKLSMKIREDDE